MNDIKKIVIDKKQKPCYSLCEAYDTKRICHKWSKNTYTLNFVNIVKYYDYEKALGKYDENYEFETWKQERFEKERKEMEERKESLKKFRESLSLGTFDYDYDDGGVKYYRRKQPEDYVEQIDFKEGLFLHLSDNDDCFLNRYAIVRLLIDEKGYKLSCFFAPAGDRGSEHTTDMYFWITPAILKALVLSSSIKFSYKIDSNEICQDVDISNFKEYALIYYEKFYLKHCGSIEEKESLRRVYAASKEAQESRKVEEMAREDQENQDFWEDYPALEKLGITKATCKKIMIWGVVIIALLIQIKLMSW